MLIKSNIIAKDYPKSAEKLDVILVAGSTPTNMSKKKGNFPQRKEYCHWWYFT